MKRIYLQHMVEDVSDSLVPQVWADHDLEFFSHTKRLYDYQQQALRNALKALWKYYEDFGDYQPGETDDVNRQRKRELMKWYRDNGLSEDLSIRAKSASASLLQKYCADYIDPKTNIIACEAFINRMGFWMATGSGKTLVIVKLIELLGRLIRLGEVPLCDILFLTHRDDLIQQLNRHVNEFNASHNDTAIVLYELKEYATIKHERRSLFRNKEIVVFYYRSDNLSDEQKEKIVDFRNYDNDGRWFVLLDEAHKGDIKDSKRQHIYSILSRNGFLFNFSATFTDPLDITTTVYNFNLSEYIRRGYGKHLLVLQQELRAFKEREDYSIDEKRKLVLKTLILLTYIRKAYEDKVKSEITGVYHRPMMLVLVNSVNTEDADLELFFRELERIARQGIDTVLCEAAKNELWHELGQSPTFLFEDDNIQVDSKLWCSLAPQDICRYVFNADSWGDVEVLVRSANRQEMAFKLKTSDRPFALIKIGDISVWLKQKLSGYEIAERFDDESLFARLNADDSDINILMGSRSFYEGWDSNRPNVICYINIGTGTDAQKFILQSVGRGVRIEPIKNKRKRLLPLYNAKDVEESFFRRLRNAVQPLETLFIFGTNRTAMQTVLSNLQKEHVPEQWQTLDVFDVSPEAERMCLLIPVYKSTSTSRVQQKLIAKLEVAQDELDALRAFVQGLDARVLLALTDVTPKQVKRLYDALQENSLFAINGRRYGDLRRLLRRVMNYLSITSEEVNGLKSLKDEIRHFKHISVSLDDIRDLKQRVERVRTYKNDSFEYAGKRIAIKHIAQHYYLPVVLSEDGNADYIRHIIKEASEVRFIKDLDSYISQEGNCFQQFDWWFFSKLDESLDEVYIPYYNPSANKISRYKPDFIFWLCLGNRYYIMFVDPKGTAHSDYQHKVDGYKELFTENGKPKEFLYERFKVTVHLFLYTDDKSKVSKEYESFWVSEIKELMNNIGPFQM